jgi:hypothetical protein
METYTLLDWWREEGKEEQRKGQLNSLKLRRRNARRNNQNKMLSKHPSKGDKQVSGGV